MSSASIDFDRAADYYDATRGFPPGVEERAIAAIRTAGHLHAHDCVLEIGIGTGRIALPVAPHVNIVFGIDLSMKMMAKLLEKRKGEHVLLAQGNAANLPYPANTFDAALVVHVFHLIPDTRQAASELARVIKPGGLVVQTWNEYGDELKPIMDVWMAYQEELRAIHAVTGGQHGAAHGARAILTDLGWTRHREPQKVTFHEDFQRHNIANPIRMRRWSTTWHLTDTQIDEAVQRMETAIGRHFGDEKRVIQQTVTFVAQAYRPPAS